MLLDKIYKKIALLSYIPLVVNLQRESSILDDEDVFVYLTTLDKELLRSVLHVEVIKDLGVNQTGEPFSRAERGSSLCVNYVEPVSSSRADDVVNAGMCNIFRAGATKQHNKPIIEEPMETGVNDNCKNVSCDDFAVVDNHVDNSLDGMHEYVELPRPIEES